MFRAGCTGRSESVSLNDFLSLGIVYAGICEAQDFGQACCIILLLAQLLSILLVFRASLCAGVCLDAGGAVHFFSAPTIPATAWHSASCSEAGL